MDVENFQARDSIHQPSKTTSTFTSSPSPRTSPRRYQSSSSPPSCHQSKSLAAVRCRYSCSRSHDSDCTVHRRCRLCRMSLCTVSGPRGQALFVLNCRSARRRRRPGNMTNLHCGTQHSLSPQLYCRLYVRSRCLWDHCRPDGIESLPVGRSADLPAQSVLTFSKGARDRLLR